MSFPERIRVKLSSEAAESISLTPVVVQEMATRDLIEQMLGVTGKDEARIRELLLRGTLVSGASRFRWEGWEASAEAVRAQLATFPDAEPGRVFSAGRCTRVVLRGARQPVDIPRAVGRKHGFLRRADFWEVLMRVLGDSGPEYREYSYRERADVYQTKISPAGAEQLRAAAGRIRYTVLRDQVRAAGYQLAELFVER